MTDEQKKQSGIRVFVYGTLKKGHGNHPFYLGDDDTVYLGRCYVEGPFQMVSFGGFPGVIANGGDSHIPNTRVYGEVYKVSEQALVDLDRLESNGEFFTRGKIDTPWKKAWMYTVPAEYLEECPEIQPEGDINALAWLPSEEEEDFIHGRIANG